MPRQRGSATAVTITTTSETIVATLPGIAVSASFPIDLLAEVELTSGTTTSGITLRIRRSALVTGTLVQAIGPDAITAPNQGLFILAATDVFAADVANQQYVVTVQQAAATANGTANYAYIRADWG